MGGTKGQPDAARLKPRSRYVRAFMAGLLTYGSSYLPSLPVFTDSGRIWRSSPITAAGPRRNCTVFPIEALASRQEHYIHLSIRAEVWRLTQKLSSTIPKRIRKTCPPLQAKEPDPAPHKQLLSSPDPRHKQEIPTRNDP